MAGLVPAMHAFSLDGSQNVDVRDKPVHDE
jgi:hypothetical protein